MAGGLSAGSENNDARSIDRVDIVVVGPDGTAQSRRGLRYELLKVETRYQWYRRENAWDIEPVRLTRRVADGQVNVTAGTSTASASRRIGSLTTTNTSAIANARKAKIWL